MPSAPQEFTPELNEDLYNKMARKISQNGAADVGNARGEALSRGLTGDPFEASAVGEARNNTTNQLNDLYTGMNYDVAGKAREERLMGQTRGYQVEDRNFSAAESDKNRALQERLARLGYAFNADQATTSFSRSFDMLPYQFAAGAGGRIIGGAV